MEFVFPPVEYLGIAYLASMVVMLLTALLLKKQIRILDLPSWILFLFIAPCPVLFATTLGGLVSMPTTALLPTVCLIAVLGTFIVHLVLPSLAPDFQTQSISVSAMCGFLLAGVAFAAGFAIKDAFPDGLLAPQEDAFGASSITWDDAAVGEK